MGQFVAVALVGAAVTYTLFMGLLIVFTTAFFGLQDFGADLLGSTIFVIMAISPLPVW